MNQTDDQKRAIAAGALLDRECVKYVGHLAEEAPDDAG